MIEPEEHFPVSNHNVQSIYYVNISMRPIPGNVNREILAAEGNDNIYLVDEKFRLPFIETFDRLTENHFQHVRMKFFHN